jgi:hypothetical protein
MPRGPAISLGGGIDLVSPASQAKPGTLAECLNYEVAQRNGYARVDGFVRYDGRPGVAEYRVLRLFISNASVRPEERARVDLVEPDSLESSEEASGEEAVRGHEDPIGTLTGYITSAANLTETNGRWSGAICVVFNGAMPDPIGIASAAITLLNEDDEVADGVTFNVSLDAFTSLTAPDGPQSAFDYALDRLASYAREQVLPVPGRTGSDVIGGFVYKDKCYAIRDLPRVFFESDPESPGYYTDDHEGLAIEINDPVFDITTQHEILAVSITGIGSGFIIYNPVEDGSLTVATPIGTAPTLTSIVVTAPAPPAFEMPDAYTGYLYRYQFEADGLDPLTWTIVGTTPPERVPPPVVDLSSVTLQAEVTPAALWVATPDGWSYVDTGRELAFHEGNEQLRNTPRATTLAPGETKDTGWVTVPPSSIALDGTTIVGLPQNITGAETASVLISDLELGLLVPEGAEIKGISFDVAFTPIAPDPLSARDIGATLVGVSGGTENKAVDPWGALTNVYGGESDLWGSENITRTALASEDFGLLLTIAGQGIADISVSVATVRVRVWYVERGGIPIWITPPSASAGDAIRATLINTQILSGSPEGQSSAGYLTIRCAPNALKETVSSGFRMIGGGDLIFLTNPASMGATAAATVLSRDRRIFLPGQFEIENNRSQYHWEQYNFFGQDRYSSMYGVSGAGPALSFDGANLIKIRAPLAPGEDVPRHIAKHGDMLALGYFSGAVLFTAVGDPFETRGAFGAAAIEVGDRLTALSPAGGDALLIVSESSTRVLRGLVPDAFVLQTVSARRGAIEYTIADPGRAILADSFGLFAADTPESFEPASRQYMSAAVAPWLRERLQATVQNEQRFIRPVTAIAVRSKTQYRLFFRDGEVLTMTLAESGIEITRQRLFNRATGERFPVKAIWTGLDASGRERIFAAFTSASKRGFVFELDVGRSFDGAAIYAMFQINPFYAGGISQTKRFDRFHFEGFGGYASLEWSFGVDGQAPTGRVVQADFGKATQPAVSSTSAARVSKLGSVQVGVECYGLSPRVESLTSTEAPHTLQFVETFIEGAGDSRGHRGN